MGVLIDASVLIEHERGRLHIGARVAGREQEPFYLSVITASELLHGVHRAADAARKAKRAAFVEAVLDRFPLLEIDIATARTHARSWAELAAGGELMGAHDLWLAAAALTHDLAVATADLRDFQRVAGLRVEYWSS